MRKLSYRYAVAVVVLVWLVGLGLNGWYWTQLPDRVATHFNLAGTPDAWMNKNVATLTICGFQIALPLFLLCVPEIATKLPAGCINIPNRRYWLSPERRDETFAVVRTCMAQIAVLVSVFFLAVNHLTYMANRDGTGLNNRWFAAVLLAFLVAVTWQTKRMLVEFRLPPNANPVRRG